MYGSFLAAAEQVLDYEGIGKYVLLLRDYALKGEDVHCSEPVIEALLTMAKPNITAAKSRYDKALKGGDDGWRGAEYGKRGGRPRLGETKEEAYERRRELWDTAKKEQKSKSALEVPINPKNPLNVNENDNVNINEKEKENDKGNDYENVNNDAKDKENDFWNSLMLNDFDDNEEDYSYEKGTISDYMNGQYLQEEERKYRYSQALETERDTYI